MAHAIPYMVGGYAVDRMMGGDGMKGALLGSGFGNFGGFGALGAGNTAANSAFAGNALGAGGMATGGSALGMGSAATGLSAGLNTGLQNVTNQVTGLGFQPQNITETLGNSITGLEEQAIRNAAMPFQDLGLNVDNALLDPITGMPSAPDMSQTNMLPALEGYQPSNIPTTPDFTPNRNVVSGTDGYVPEQSGMFDGGLLNYLGEFVPDEKDMGGLALGMGIDALTPEQQERLRHQNAMLMRGQTGNLLGQGGYKGIGGQYISRA